MILQIHTHNIISLFCGVIEDETHFLLNCYVNVTYRECFCHEISQIHDRFMSLNDEEIFFIYWQIEIPTWYASRNLSILLIR